MKSEKQRKEKEHETIRNFDARKFLRKKNEEQNGRKKEKKKRRNSIFRFMFDLNSFYIFLMFITLLYMILKTI